MNKRQFLTTITSRCRARVDHTNVSRKQPAQPGLWQAGQTLRLCIPINEESMMPRFVSLLVMVLSVITGASFAHDGKGPVSIQ